MAPKTDMMFVKDHVGSTDVTYLEFSKEAGYRADYGHLDLNLGLHARDEVYPKIYDWLVQHSQSNFLDTQKNTTIIKPEYLL